MQAADMYLPAIDDVPQALRVAQQQAPGADHLRVVQDLRSTGTASMCLVTGSSSAEQHTDTCRQGAVAGTHGTQP